MQGITRTLPAHYLQEKIGGPMVTVLKQYYIRPVRPLQEEDILASMQEESSGIKILLADAVRRSSVLAHQNIEFVTWSKRKQETATVELCQRERQEEPLASNSRLPIQVQTGGLGASYCALSFMTECRVRGDQVMRILDSMRVECDRPGIGVWSAYKYVFDMHETISTHQEMMHKATVLHLQPKRHISYHDIRDYDYEKIKARTADFLLATSLDKLRSSGTRLRRRLEQLQSINANILTQTAVPFLDVPIWQRELSKVAHWVGNTNDQELETHALFSVFIVNSAGERTLSKQNWKVVKKNTKVTQFALLWVEALATSSNTFFYNSSNALRPRPQ